MGLSQSSWLALDKSFKHFARVWGAPEESVLLLAPCMQCAVSGGRAGRLHADWWKGQTSVSAVRAACAVSSLSPFFILSGEGDGREAEPC